MNHFLKGLNRVLLKSGFFVVVGFLGICSVIVTVKYDDVFAGAIILKDSTKPSGSGGGDGGSCTTNENNYRLDCAGASWMYFKWNSSVDYKNPITFGKLGNLWNDESTAVKIPTECKQTGGFWHYGINRKWTTNNPASKVGNFSGKKGRWGHWWTLSYNVVSWVDTKQKSSYDQKILNSSGKTIYASATRSAAKRLADYKAALEQEIRQTGKEPTKAQMKAINKKTDVDAGVYLFCAWSDYDPDPVTLDVEEKNIYDNNDLTDSNEDEAAEIEIESNTVNQNSWAKVSYAYGGNKYKFIGWKETPSAGLGGLITRSSKSGENSYGSSAASYTYDNDKTIYRNLNVYLKNKDKTVYAYYAPKYNLTVKAGTGTKITVDRKFTTYSRAMDWAELSKSKLYKDDYLKICVTLDSGYTLTSFKINNNSITGKDTYCSNTKASEFRVLGDTVIEATATKPPQNVTLTAYAVDSAGKLMNSNNRIDYHTVQYNNKATVHNNKWTPPSDYKFLCWKSASTAALTVSAACSGTLPSYSVNNLKSNGTIYAVYRKLNNYKFTIVHVDTEKTKLSCLSDYVATVQEGNSHSHGHGSCDGYAFKGWKNNLTDTSYAFGSSVGDYSVSNMSSDVTVYAVFEPASFSGRARIKVGTSVDDTNSTGYVDKSETKTLNDVPCLNTGCSAAWDLALKRSINTGTTEYKIGTKNNSDNTVWLPSSSFSTFPTTTVTSTVGGGTGSNADKLYPGQSKCHYIRFKPVPLLKNDTVDVGVCWNAQVSYFQGKSDILYGNSESTTDWRSSSRRITYEIKNCSPSNGCNVKFNHALRRTSGKGDTDWSISRTSNYWISTKSLGVEPRSNFASGNYESYKDTASTSLSKTGPWKLYPGMVVCEMLTFKPNNNVVNVPASVTTTACASALGSYEPCNPNDLNGGCSDAPCDLNNPNCDVPCNVNDPEDKCGDNNNNDASDTLLNIEVRNNSVSKYNTFRRLVYAKPNDELEYRPTYNPLLQRAYEIKVEKMQIDGNLIIYPTNKLNYYRDSVENKNSLSLGTLFNNNRKDSLKNWNNAYNLEKINFDSGLNSNRTYDRGDFTFRSGPNETPTVMPSEVGRSLNMKVATNVNDNVKTTPSQVTVVSKDGNNTANVITTPISSTAFARIPYNFYNTSSIATTDGMVLYAGEKKVINIKLIVNPRDNTVTDGKYATLVKNAKKGIMVCDGNDQNCSEPLIEEAGTLNSNGLIKGSTEKQNITITVPDVVAGSKVCLHSGIYPSNSGALTNYSDEKGSDAWKWSDKVCLTVAKRPSFQVWGGNIYSSSNIKVGLSTKNHLAGEEYKANVTSGPYIFGSWGELGLITTGQVSELASGATLGYSGTNLQANPGGGGKNERGRCQRALLTVPNSSLCYTSGMSLSMNLGSLTQQKNSNETKTALIDKFKENNYTLGDDVTVVDLGVEPSEDIKRNNGMGLYHYYHSKNNIQLNAATIGMNTIKVVQADGNITINGDLRYENATFTSYDAMPKLLIYGKNINISCGVNQIDAVLIADKTVNTCGDSDNINSEKNARQLRVNGAIIANGLYLNRTFGARPGNDSIVPAEIINFDSSLYVFGSSKTEVTNSNDLVVTYTREVAPRF